MNRHHHPAPFPRLLLSMRNLQGGQYGTLDVTARAADTVELALGGDYVWLQPDEWRALRAAVDKFFCTDLEATVVVTTTRTEERQEVEVLEDRECEPESRPPHPPRPPRPGFPPGK